MKGLIATVGRAVLCDYGNSRSGSPEVANFVANSTFLNSGTSALSLALQHAIERGGHTGKAEVILPAYCCPDVLSAVRNSNAAPVLVDFEPNTTWMDPRCVSSALTKNTAAIVAINFLGIAERLDAIRKLIDNRNCALIDDSCQAAPQPEHELRNADYRVFSFGRGKPISLLHGGAIQSRFGQLRGQPDSGDGPFLHRTRSRIFNATRNRYLFSMLFALGMAGATRYSAAGPVQSMHGYPLSVIPAAIDAYWARGDDIQQQLHAGIKSAASGDMVILPWVLCDAGPGRLLRYPVLAGSRQQRDRIVARLRHLGICATALYGNPLPDIPGTALDVESSEYPVAREFADKLITLSLHEEISGDIVATILRVLTESR